MADYHDALLEAARHLITRRTGQRGPLPAARIRRSISTAYYALFHFMAAECSALLVGSAPALVQRRRLLARVLTHTGMRLTFRKMAGMHAAVDVADFLRSGGSPAESLPIPLFVQGIARVFLQAQEQRHRADYDLGSLFSAFDANNLIQDVDAAIRNWQAAATPQDRQFKEGLCLLLTLRGRLRADDA